MDNFEMGVMVRLLWVIRTQCNTRVLLGEMEGQGSERERCMDRSKKSEFERRGRRGSAGFEDGGRTH